jgi:RNA polymerase sigma-70 factor, ECF subfamily
MTTALTLAPGRLRPVSWGWLTVLALGWLPATRALTGIPGDPELGVVVFRWAALLLGLGAAILTAPETDPPRDILRAMPMPLWRTLALRLAGWLLLGAAPVLAMALGLGGTTGWTTTELGWGVLPNLLLVTAAGFLAARATSTMGGGAAALATVIALDAAARAWPAGFPVQLHSVPGDPYWQASQAWMVAGSLGLIAVGLALERRSGQRLRLSRRRRPSARPGPARPDNPGTVVAMMGAADMDATVGVPPDRAAAEVAGDDTLVQAVAAGDRRALELLYRRHASWLAGRLAAGTSSIDLAEEALQDTFLAVWRSARAYHGRGEVPAWLWGIARRRLASLARRQRPGALSLEAAAEPPDLAATPEEAVLGQDASTRIHLAIARLPPEQQAAITAVVYEGKSIEEAALAAAVPEGTLKSRLHRARLHLRKELGP